MPTGGRSPLNPRVVDPDNRGMPSVMSAPDTTGDFADPAAVAAPPAPRWRRILGLALRVTPVLGLIVAVGTWSHLPRMRLEPAALGLACWTVGNYPFCPLRWRSVSSQGQKLRWYARVYAEGELLGMLTPQHAGADLWRIRQLVHSGADRRSAVVEVAADRLARAVMIVALAFIAGATVPPRFFPLAGLALATVAGAAWLARGWWGPR